MAPENRLGASAIFQLEGALVSIFIYFFLWFCQSFSPLSGHSSVLNKMSKINKYGQHLNKKFKDNQTLTEMGSIYLTHLQWPNIFLFDTSTLYNP